MLQWMGRLGLGDRQYASGFSIGQTIELREQGCPGHSSRVFIIKSEFLHSINRRNQGIGRHLVRPS